MDISIHTRQYIDWSINLFRFAIPTNTSTNGQQMLFTIYQIYRYISLDISDISIHTQRYIDWSINLFRFAIPTNTSTNGQQMLFTVWFCAHRNKITVQNARWCYLNQQLHLGILISLCLLPDSLWNFYSITTEPYTIFLSLITVPITLNTSLWNFYRITTEPYTAFLFLIAVPITLSTSPPCANYFSDSPHISRSGCCLKSLSNMMLICHSFFKFLGTAIIDIIPRILHSWLWFFVSHNFLRSKIRRRKLGRN